MTIFWLSLLVIVFAASLVLDWAANVLPTRELHRRMRLELPEHRTAKRLYGFKAYGWFSQIILWLLGSTSAAVLLLWSAKTSYFLFALLAVIISLLVLNRRRPQRPAGLLWNLAGWLAAALTWLLQWFEPLLSKSSRQEHHQLNTGLFETADLEDLLAHQAHQPDNRISDEDLDTARAAVAFSTKTVSSIMVPIKDVRIVLPDEAIGPHLMDELHGSGYSSFPVGKKVGKKLPPQIEGVVYLKDLVSNLLKTTVSQVAINEVSYIDQDQKLSVALEEFLKGHSLVLIVTNEREEPVGALWLEDVLEQLLGRKVAPEADNPADADIRQIHDARDKLDI